MNFIDKDLLSIQEARVLSENAGIAGRSFTRLAEEKLNKALELSYMALKENLFCISKMYVEESGYGNIEEEYFLNELLIEKLYKSLINDEVFKGNEEYINIPIGGVLLITSKKNVVSGIINSLLLCIKTGNVLIAATDKRSIKTTEKIINTVSHVLSSNGYVGDICSYLSNVSKAGISELINSKYLTTIINLGNKAFISECNLSGKILYYASTGASPVFIERSAYIPYAIKDIVQSRSFNNGILPGAEQFLVVDEPVLEEVINELKQNKVYFMSKKEEEKLLNLLIKEKEEDEEFIGKSAYTLAFYAGFSVPDDTKILAVKRDYIFEFDSYINEMSVPLLVIYEESDWINACEKCIKLLTNNGDGHSLSIYSRDEKIIKEFISKKPVGRVIINSNTTFSAMGLDSNAYPSAVLGVFTRGIGYLSENLSPKHLIYKRHIVRKESLTDRTCKENIKIVNKYSDKEIRELFKLLLSDN